MTGVGIFKPRYIPGFDGMRAFSAAIVMACHLSTPGFGLGWSGVSCFFVLSGFLITGILVDAKDTENYYAAFYARRALRILPAYYITIFAIIAIGIARKSDISDWPYFVAYLQNFPYSIASSAEAVRFPLEGSHTWSLAVEEQFYLLWPFVVMAVSQKTLMRIAIALIVFSPIFRWLAFQTTGHWFASYSLLPCQADMLAWGAMAALLNWKRDRAVIERVALYSAAIFLCLIVALSFYKPIVQLFVSFKGSVFYGLLGATYLSWIIVAQSGGRLTKLLELPPLRYLGRISYGLYLYHWPIFLIIDDLRMPYGPAFIVALKLSLTFLLAAISYALIEQPLLNMKDKLFPPTRSAEILEASQLNCRMSSGILPKTPRSAPLGRRV
jgi:peptidoglycan/LPS O-acetylase OafA/YrhL